MSQTKNPIDRTFETLRQGGRKAFIPFMTAGDPDIDTSLQVAETLIENGADIIEIGFPYSDPIADGPVIQSSYTRALDKKLKIEQIWQLAQAIQKSPAYANRAVPLVAMVSYSLVLRVGIDTFLMRAKKSGFSGLIVPDLPWDESAELGQAIDKHELKLVQLVTPATPGARAAEIAKASGGFLYCVSISGITGERRDLPATLIDRLAALRSQSTTPLCVGFGISTAEQAQTLKPHCDGVIVGSALVRHLEKLQAEPRAKVFAGIAAFCKSMRSALDQ